MGTSLAARDLVTLGSVWRFPNSTTADVDRRVVMVSPFVRTVRMDGTFGGEWRGGVDEFLERHDYVGPGSR